MPRRKGVGFVPQPPPANLMSVASSPVDPLLTCLHTALAGPALTHARVCVWSFGRDKDRVWASLLTGEVFVTYE